MPPQIRLEQSEQGVVNISTTPETETIWSSLFQENKTSFKVVGWCSWAVANPAGVQVAVLSGT